MKNNKKILAILILVFSLVLSACGIKITNDVKVDQNFSGTRSILLEISNDDMNYFEGGREGLNEFLQYNIKDPLVFAESRETESGYAVLINLNFNSIEDYNEKLKSLVGEEFTDSTPLVSYVIPSEDNPFLSGISFNDNVSSQIILRYLVNAAVEQGRISESNAGSVWDSENYSLTINDEVILEQSGVPVSYEDSDYIGPYEVAMYTTPSESGETYNRTFKVNMEGTPQDSEWWKYIFPEDNVEYLEENNDVHLFVMKDATLEQIAEATKTMLGSSNHEISISAEPVEEGLGIVKRLYEKGEVASYNPDIYLSSSFYDMYIDPINLAAEDHGEYSSAYLSLYDILDGVEKINEISPSFRSIEVNTNVEIDSKFTRTIKMDLGESLDTELFKEQLKTKLEEAGIESTGSENILQYSYSGDDFEEKNRFMFSGEVTREEEDLSLFKKVDKVTEAASINYPYFEEYITNASLADDSDENSFIYSTFEYGTFYLNSEYVTIKILPIILIALGVIALTIAIILFVRHVKKKREEGPNSYDFEKYADKTRRVLASTASKVKNKAQETAATVKDIAQESSEKANTEDTNIQKFRAGSNNKNKYVEGEYNDEIDII